jgi:uncharacterized protein with NAD-binding domain and iron-sulfur cluster
MEFHLYTWSKTFPKNATDDEIWGLISPTISQIFPEIFAQNFKVLAYNVNSYENFSSFQKGLMGFRPTTNSLSDLGLQLYLAGDWIKTDYPSALMERAVSTGKI